ncbi:MAG: glycoside hydrolase family 38 C-terminal domain-containing protein [Anaerohalosphaeraceae bacterium]
MTTSYSQSGPRNFDRDKTLYVVGYSHLDSQWRWDYPQTIDVYIKNTLDDNFKLLETYPDYIFNFSGAARYAMMKEYYPEKYERLKKYISQGRWFVCGSSVDECDVLIPSPESILRQILYGNQYFRKEFKAESEDFILPDCFGFPSYLPSLWAHTGLIGFSSQKLTWGSAMGIPFNVGVWEGPDGRSVIAALNPGNYTGGVSERLDISKEWISRVHENGWASGVFADYHYYGVGDVGGAPREADVQKAVASLGNEDAEIDVVLSSADQMYKDITPQQKARLPKYTGELMLTEHSSGAMTSQAYMKRWNRRNEQLADAAERAAVMADWLGGMEYPYQQLHQSWWRVLASQMHDILPGTCLPKSYEYAWNDEIIAANGFAEVLNGSVGAVSRALDTRVKGQAIVVFNALSFEREDIAEAKVVFAEGAPKAVRVYNPQNKEVPSQVLSIDGNTIKVAFLASVPAVGAAVYDIRPSSKACTMRSGLAVDERTLENAYYRVTLNDGGDIAGIYDKQAKRELLSRPAGLEFHRGTPKAWPAWNMDWRERALPEIGYVDGPADIWIVENGPARVAIEVKRQAANSVFVQRFCLSAGDSGKRVEVKNDVEWQSMACVLKASFPLTVSNQTATYTQGLGTIQRSNNNPRQFEMLSHEWFDLTDTSGEYGVSILEDCKFGSDKPADDLIRLTLLYTPGAMHGSYQDQLSQDWGRHEFTYAVYGHAGNWQKGLSERQGRRLNQPLRVFQVQPHSGVKGKSLSMLQINTGQVDVRAIKKAEDGQMVVIRLQELLGRNADGVELSLGQGIVSGYEIDGQEREIGPADIQDGKLTMSMSKNAIRSFAVKLADSASRLEKPYSCSVSLPYNIAAFSKDGVASDGAFGAEKRSMPGEERYTLSVNWVRFGMRGGEGHTALACQGQTLRLPEGDYNRIYLLACADQDTADTIKIGDRPCEFRVQAWTGFVGQYDRRIWDREFGVEDYVGAGRLLEIQKGYIKRDPIAWFSTHRHTAEGKNESYQFSYIFKYGYDLPKGTATITLPDNPAIKIFSVTVASDMNLAVNACDLYDNFDGRQDIELRRRPGDYTAGKQAVGKAAVERADSYEQLTLAKPLADDYADQNSKNGVQFFYAANGPFAAPSKGLSRGILYRMNNGQGGQNSDDTNQATYFDGGEARIVADLQKPVTITKVNTFSWHRSDRAPQMFSLWASSSDAAPEADLYAADGSGWTLIARVETESLREGGVHVSSVTLPADRQYRYLMWVADREAQGTFFNEMDVFIAE